MVILTGDRQAVKLAVRGRSYVRQHAALSFTWVRVSYPVGFAAKTARHRHPVSQRADKHWALSSNNVSVEGKALKKTCLLLIR